MTLMEIKIGGGGKKKIGRGRRGFFLQSVFFVLLSMSMFVVASGEEEDNSSRNSCIVGGECGGSGSDVGDVFSTGGERGESLDSAKDGDEERMSRNEATTTAESPPSSDQLKVRLNWQKVSPPETLFHFGEEIVDDANKKNDGNNKNDDKKIDDQVEAGKSNSKEEYSVLAERTINPLDDKYRHIIDRLREEFAVIALDCGLDSEFRDMLMASVEKGFGAVDLYHFIFSLIEVVEFTPCRSAIPFPLPQEERSYFVQFAPGGEENDFIKIRLSKEIYASFSDHDLTIIFFNGKLVFLGEFGEWYRADAYTGTEFRYWREGMVSESHFVCNLLSAGLRRGDVCWGSMVDRRTPSTPDIMCVIMYVGGRVIRGCVKPPDFPISPLTTMPGNGVDLGSLTIEHAVTPFDIAEMLRDELSAHSVNSFDELKVFNGARLTARSSLIVENLQSLSTSAIAFLNMKFRFPSFGGNDAIRASFPGQHFEPFQLPEIDKLGNFSSEDAAKFEHRVLHEMTKRQLILLSNFVSGRFFLFFQVESIRRLNSLAAAMLSEYLLALARHKSETSTFSAPWFKNSDEPIISPEKNRKTMENFASDIPASFIDEINPPASLLWCLLPMDHHRPESVDELCSEHSTVCALVLLLSGDMQQHELCLSSMLEQESSYSDFARIPSKQRGDESNNDDGSDRPTIGQTIITDEESVAAAANDIADLVVWLAVRREELIRARHALFPSSSRSIVETSSVLLLKLFVEEAHLLAKDIGEVVFTMNHNDGKNADDDNASSQRRRKKKMDSVGGERTAVCVTGAMRSADAVYYKNLQMLASLEPLDFFVVTMDDETSFKSLLFRPAVLVLKNDTWLDERHVVDGFFYRDRPHGIQRLLQQWKAMETCWNAIRSYSRRTGVQYTQIVRYRSDTIYNIPSVEEINDGEIHVTPFYLYGSFVHNEVCSDNFAVGKPEAMEVYLSKMLQHCLDNRHGIVPYRVDGAWYTENMLQACLDAFNLTAVKHSEWKALTVRAAGTCGTMTCW